MEIGDVRKTKFRIIFSANNRLLKDFVGYVRLSLPGGTLFNADKFPVTLDQTSFLFLQVRHMKIVAVHGLGYQIPRQVGRPAKSLISEMSIALGHGASLVGE